MNEMPFFFTNATYKLFGILYEPMNHSNGKGFVCCSAFAEEKLWSDRVFVNFARKLAEYGYSVLRFDYMGHGDSEGNFEDSTVETRLSDIKCATQTLRSKTGAVEKIGLLGLRFGATLAAIVAEEDSNVDRLILWEPVINGASYMNEMLRINLSTQMAIYKEIRHNRETLIQMMKDGKTVNVDGYEISLPLYEHVLGIDLLDEKKTHKGNTLLVQTSRKKINIDKNINKLRSLYDDCEMAMAVEEPFWKEIKFFYSRAENLFQITLDWLMAK